VLIVEDHPLNMSIARKLLENVGISVIAAVNGQEAVERFNMNYDSINAILMDIRMPVMDGLEATRLIRSSARKNSRDIPIIAMTANAFEEDRKAALDAGMDEHISKPIDIDKMKYILSKFLKK
jgi:CheY-like chemotaxis protein